MVLESTLPTVAEVHNTLCHLYMHELSCHYPNLWQIADPRACNVCIALIYLDVRAYGSANKLLYDLAKTLVDVQVHLSRTEQYVEGTSRVHRTSTWVL